MQLTTTNSTQRGQEGCECGYYYLHRNLKKLFLHFALNFKLYDYF